MKVGVGLLISRVNASQEVIRILYSEFRSVSVLSPEKKRVEKSPYYAESRVQHTYVTTLYKTARQPSYSSISMQLQAITQRTLPLRRTQTSLKEEPEPLYRSPIRHPVRKPRGIRARNFHDTRISLRRRKVLPDGPRPISVLALGAQHPVVQQLSSLWMRRIDENGAVLGPRSECAVDGEGDVEAGGRGEADGGGE